MARILVHAVAATAGGGVTYLRNFLAQVAERGRDHDWLVLAPAGWEERPAPNLSFRSHRPVGTLRRLYSDQWGLRALLRRERIDLLLATGNFGMVRPPIPQLLLSRNALYFSHEHTQILRTRGEVAELVRILLRRRLALASIKGSTRTIVPTAAMADDIRRFAPQIPLESFTVLPHGFDVERFVRPSASLDARFASQLSSAPGVRRILLVSHYNYFRNFETLFAATALLQARCPSPIELLLTTRLGEGIHDHRYDTTEAASAIHRLGIADSVTMLGQVPRDQLYPLYRAADVVVCPSYAESFGHPMVEAMASGRPVVASDRACHREICGPAGTYFSTFDPTDLAHRIEQLLSQPEAARQLGELGEKRARRFRWDQHFESLLGVIDDTLATTAPATGAIGKRQPCRVMQGSPLV